MRRTKPIRVGELWNDFLSSTPNIARKIAEAKISDEWPRVAGAVAARFTDSLQVRSGVLYIHITSSVMRNELFMQRNALKDALNQAVGMEVIRTIILK